MNNNIQIPDSFNRLSAYLDGRLSPEEMQKMDLHVSTDDYLSSVISDLEELDQSIIDNIAIDVPSYDLDSFNVSLPEIDNPYDDFSNAGGRFVDAFDSLSLEFHFDDDSHVNYSLGDDTFTNDETDNNSLNDLQ